MTPALDSLHWDQDKKQNYLDSSRKYYWTPEQLSEIAKYLPTDKIHTAVDVGTGKGFFAFYLRSILSENTTQVWGVDINEALIAKAQEAAVSNKQTVNFKQASIYDLPFPSGTADLITEQLVLLHLETPSSAIIEIKRCLTPNGIAVFVEPNNTAVALIDDSAKRMLTTEEYLDIVGLELAYNLGKRLCGEGDSNIGDILPRYLGGFEILDVKLVERVDIICPPYTKDQLEMIEFLYGKESYNQSPDLYRRYCLCAKMSEDNFTHRWLSLEKLNKIRQEQIKANEYVGLHVNVDYVYTCKNKS